MILRRLTIASGYLSELRGQLRVFRRRETGVLSPTLARLSRTKSVLRQPTQTGAEHRRLVRADVVSTQQASTGAYVQPQIEGGTGRLLAAKKRAGSGRVL